MRPLISVITIVLLCFSISVMAQRVNTSVYGMLGFPVGDYKNSIDQIGYGLEVSFRIAVPESPIWLGLDFGQLSLKQKSRFINTGGDEFQLLPLKGEILAHLAVRAQIEREGLIPYFEGLIGMQHFYSQSENDKDPVYYEQNDASGFSTSEADKVLSAGISAGLLFHIYKYKEISERKIKDIYIETRLRLLTGGKTEIIKELDGSDEDHPNYEAKTVRPNMLTLQIGVSFDF